uniref:Uncharacterized protein n=1 Tax=Arundo donax TaxID=35708 RepID=A0A0A9D6U4_ARUDO
MFCSSFSGLERFLRFVYERFLIPCFLLILPLWFGCLSRHRLLPRLPRQSQPPASLCRLCHGFLPFMDGLDAATGITKRASGIRSVKAVILV